MWMWMCVDVDVDVCVSNPSILSYLLPSYQTHRFSRAQPCLNSVVCSALTEKIVAALPRMKCPHRLEPHQIQGLDFKGIFPVVQVS